MIFESRREHAVRLPHPIILLLIANCLLLDVCAWAVVRGQNSSAPADLFFATVVICQFNLLAVWAAIGPGNILVRFSVAAAATALLTLFAAAFGHGALFEERALAFVATQFATIAAMLAVTRSFGRRLYSPKEIAQMAESSNAPTPWQFSIADLLKTTTAWAVFAAAMVRVRERTPGPSLEVSMTVLIGLMFAFPIPAIVFGVFYPIPLAVRIVLVGMASGLSLLLTCLVPDHDLIWFAMVGSQLLVGAALLCIRAAGYRLLRTNAPR
jgi:hypothetical protein